MKVNLEKNVMQANNELAAELRQSWRERGVFVLNLISSPGSGKTSLLEKTLERLQGKVKAAVLVGDLQTENDAQRLAGYGFPVKQIVTSGTCHIKAQMIQKHLPFVDSEDLELLIIENVGNLVCPTSYDLGEDCKVVLVSTTEGEDKPLKYPGIFRKAELAVVTKIDLLPFLDFDVQALRRNISSIHEGMEILEVSSRTGEGMDRWIEWLLERVQRKKAAEEEVS